MKCKYCENEATTKDYREWDGQTGKELVCNHCFGITNEGLLKRRDKVDKALKEIFNNFIPDYAEEFLETGWGEMWDTINEIMFQRRGDLSDQFESETGHQPHDDTLDKWNDKIVSKIDKLIKKSI